MLHHETRTRRPEIMLWLDDHRGIYLPRDFANSFADRERNVANVNAEQWEILENPDHEFYWEVWAEVLDNAIVTDERGNKYFVYQDGDVWLVPDGMVYSEQTEFFIWPD